MLTRLAVMMLSKGVCTVYCGRKTACLFKHYSESRDDHGFVHPGFISLGDTCVIPLNANITRANPALEQKRKRKSPSAKASPPTLPSAAAAKSNYEIDQIVMVHEAIIAAAPESTLPVA